MGWLWNDRPPSPLAANSLREIWEWGWNEIKAEWQEFRQKARAAFDPPRDQYENLRDPSWDYLIVKLYLRSLYIRLTNKEEA